MAGARDFYDDLGVARTASEDEIRRAYRSLARKYHPDINKDVGADDRFKEISEAYEVLRDPEKRAKYDGLVAAGASGFRSGGFGGGPRAGGFQDTPYGDGADFGDLFESIFGARSAGASSGFSGSGFGSRPRRGADHESFLDLSLEQVAAGGKHHVTLSDGRTYDVALPVGAADGQRIRLAGEGGPGSDGGPPGDLFLTVRLRPHPGIRLDGSDLYVDLLVTPSEAALGAEVPVRTLTGQARVQVPACSSTGRRLRLRGEGLPRAGGGRGNLYAEIRIVLPPALDDAERTLYQELAEASGFDPRRPAIRQEESR
ncbi:MAG: DnaJ C-terminal domain-containing protein [Acidimicrobiia bacterium]